MTSSANDSGEERCDHGRTCAGVHTLVDRPDLYYVIVTEVVDRDELAAFARRIGPGERLGTVGRAIIDDVPR